MDLIAKLPEMSDDSLANLRTNAKRLQQSGTPAQRSDAKSAPDGWLEYRRREARCEPPARAQARLSRRPSARLPRKAISELPQAAAWRAVFFQAFCRLVGAIPTRTECRSI